ncbi:MAG TPA: DUF4832 domain-containing protein [Terriglobia bacterium]|nr:DUF4832 domain-containing protein [Terriglobia bacterium]
MRIKVMGVVAALVFSTALAFAQNNNVIVRPKEIDTVLVNPGMGVQTFQRFNGDPLNAGLRWSERGPTKVLKAAAEKPDFPESSISYCRWFWNVLEPEQGKYNWGIIDTALEQARLHHQTLAIRLMPYDQRDPLPEWYQNSGAHRANKPTDEDGKIWQPDFTDPLYLKYWGDLVAAAGARYDGNPYLDTVDISSVGYWGEGWSNYMPPFKYQKALIDIYLDAFKRTPLLMNFDEQQALSYGTSHGAGWRLDCWGDMRTPRWGAMLDAYPEQVVRAGIQTVWERSPVSLESCGVPGSWFKRGYDLNYILQQALRWHVSSANIKSSAIPPQWKQQFREFEKEMGYRFILRRLEYPKEVRPGAMMPVNVWFLNAGVAPVYRDYTLAVELSSSEGSAVIKTSADVRKWLPGDAVFEDTLFVPQTLKPDQYHFRVGLLDPRTGLPAIKLAIEGRQPDGWYDLGVIEVR